MLDLDFGDRSAPSEKGKIASPARLFADGTIASARMLLPFYDATIEMRVPQLHPERGATIAIEVGGQNLRNPRPSLSMRMSVAAAIQLVEKLRHPELIDPISLPASTAPSRAHNHARQGVVRAFLSIFGQEGKHLVEAALWAVSDNFQPERPEIAEGLAKYLVVRVADGDRVQIDRCDTTELEPRLAMWVRALRTVEVSAQLIHEFQRFIPFTE